MRIDGLGTPLPRTAPQAAPGGGPPVDRAELSGAAGRLENQGYQFQVFKKAWWPLSNEEWRVSDRQESLEHLTSDREVQLVKGDETQRVLSQSDLIELDAFTAKNTGSLPSPVLAGSLAALARLGQFRGDNGNLTTYETYNVVTGDPNHERQSVSFVVNGQAHPIRNAEDAQTAAWLLAGFGDGKGVAPTAVQLKAIQDLGYRLDPWQAYRSGAPITLSFDGQPLARVPLDQLDSAKAKQMSEEWTKLKSELGREAPGFWELAHLKADQVPFDQRVDAMKTLADKTFYRMVVDGLGPREKLADKVQEALEVAGRAPDLRPVDVYSGWQRSGEAFPRLAARTGDLKLADKLARSLTPETEPHLHALLDDLAALEPAVANELAVALVEDKTLVEGRGLVAEIAAPDGTARDILAARDAIRQGEVEPRKEAFLAYRQAEAPVASATRLLQASPEADGVTAYRSLREAGLEDRQALPLLEAMAASLQEGEPLSALVGPALKLHEASPKAYLEAYPEMRRTVGREEGFVELLKRTQNPQEAASLVAQLSPEEAKTFCASWDAFKEKGNERGPGLLREAANQGRLLEDAGRLERARNVQVYQSMLKLAPPGTEDAFLELVSTPNVRDQGTTWKALNHGVPAEVAGRLELWKGWQTTLGDRAADRLLAAIPAGLELEPVRETFAVLQAKNPKTALESFEKVYTSQASELLSNLVRGGADLAEATEMARRVSRHDLPGAMLAEEQRCELVGRLGKLRGGNLQEGFQDFLFLATRVEDHQDIPMAVNFFSALRETGLSPEEARMAYAELSRREDMTEHQDSVMKVYRFASDLAGAREILDSAIKLSPAEAASRLDQVVSRPLDGLEPRLRSRLAAGHLQAPLPPEGLDGLGHLLGTGGLYWEPQPGWTVAGTLRLETPRGTKTAGALESTPFRVPSEGDALLSFDYDSTRQPARLLALVEDQKEPVVLASLGEGKQGTDIRVRLSSLRDKKIRLRLESSRGDLQSLEVKNLKLVTTAMAGNTELDVSEFQSNGVHKSPVQLSAARPTQLYLDFPQANRALSIEAHDGSAWSKLGEASGASEELRIDLSAYRGKKISLRIHSPRDGGLGTRPRAAQLRENPQKPVERSLIPTSQSSAVAEEVLKMAFDPQRPPDERVSTLRALAHLGDDLQAAWAAWPVLEPHVGAADFEDRVEAVRALLPEAGLLSEVEAARRPGESLTTLARLRKGRTAQEFEHTRERLGWESLGERGALDFVGQVQARAGVEAADKAWVAVAAPIHDDSLEERTRAYLDLLDGCGGDGELTEQAYRKLASWIEPQEGIQRAARGAVELKALIPDPKEWLKLIDTLQASQLDGRLQGVMLKRMSAYLIGKVTLEGVKLADALQLMPEELKGKTGIEEREQHLVVGGTRLGRR